MMGSEPLRLDTVPGYGRTLVFPIENHAQAPTITTSKYIFFGRVDVTMQAAAGAGIVTSVVLQSDDLDEIDWEWVGGNNAQVYTNYFSKGNTSEYNREVAVPVKEPLSSLHTYSIHWTTDKLEWLIDNVVVRTLPYNKADNGKANGFPQAPMVLRVGTWVAGKEGNAPGTIEWAGGLADFSKAPFNAYLKNITMEDYSKGTANATQYRYLDNTGLMENIRAETVEEAKELDDAVVPPTVGDGEQGPGLGAGGGESSGGSGGLGAGGIAGIVVGFVAAIAIIAALIFVLLRQRKKGDKGDDEKPPQTPAVDDEKGVGVDAKMELDGTTFAEMSAELPPPKEMDGECEMRKELDADCEIPAEVAGDVKDIKSLQDSKDVKDVKDAQEEIYELMVHEPGDDLIPNVHELPLPSPLTPSQGLDSPTIDRLPSPLSPDDAQSARK